MDEFKSNLFCSQVKILQKFTIYGVNLNLSHRLSLTIRLLRKITYLL